MNYIIIIASLKKNNINISWVRGWKKMGMATGVVKDQSQGVKMIVSSMYTVATY